MHILAGESALRALRAARFRELAIALPRPAVSRAAVRLPGQWRRALEGHAEPQDFLLASGSLAEERFPFDAVESNAKVDFFALGDIGAFSARRPLELAVFSQKQKAWRTACHTHVLKQSLPSSSLICVNPILYFVCPEIIAVQLASRLDALELALLIMELCGTFSPEAIARDGRRCNFGVEPVATIESIRQYAKLIRSRGGAQTLKQALSIALEGAASPSEAKLALAMSLPAEMGGYGFDKPALNAKLNVPDGERDRVGAKTYYLDAFWQDAYTDLEYESTEFHLDPLVAEGLVAVRDDATKADPEAVRWRHAYISKADADRRRLRDLQYLGCKVIPVTTFDLQATGRMDQVARSLARNFERSTGASMDDWSDALDEHAYRERRRTLLEALGSGTVL